MKHDARETSRTQNRGWSRCGVGSLFSVGCRVHSGDESKSSATNYFQGTQRVGPERSVLDARGVGPSNKTVRY